MCVYVCMCVCVCVCVCALCVCCVDAGARKRVYQVLDVNHGPVGALQVVAAEHEGCTMSRWTFNVRVERVRTEAGVQRREFQHISG